MQVNFLNELLGQPEALTDLINHYESEPPKHLIASDDKSMVLLTGMGASYHAASITVYQLQRRKIFAQAMEATELLNYPGFANSKYQELVYISQSGASGEVTPLLSNLPAYVKKIAITNNLNSPLAAGSDYSFPILAGEELTVASKTYLNSLALLALMSGIKLSAFYNVRDRIKQLLDMAEQRRSLWLDTLSSTNTLYFLGHGPHAFTARHCAMMVAEWAKRPALYAGIGAFRHGFVESVEEGRGAVIFAPAGSGQQSAFKMAEELESYGAKVLLVENGYARRPADKTTFTALEDELLSPMLDIIPVQLFVEALAQQRDVSPGFRYISKVVQKL